MNPPARKTKPLNHQNDPLVNFTAALPLGSWFHARATSDSMHPTIRKGDTVRIRRVPFSDVRPRDIIAYAIRKRRHIIVHRAMKKIANQDKPVWMTKGDHLSSPDGYMVTEDDFIGIVEPMPLLP